MRRIEIITRTIVATCYATFHQMADRKNYPPMKSWKELSSCDQELVIKAISERIESPTQVTSSRRYDKLPELERVTDAILMSIADQLADLLPDDDVSVSEPDK